MKICLLCLLLTLFISPTFVNAADKQSLAPLTFAGQLLKNIPYGPHAKQRMDVYLPDHAHKAPIIVMVHGGGWTAGDKALRGVADQKAAHWLPRGFIVVSVNYRLVPAVTPLQQADDVGAALKAIAKHAPEWGGDLSRIVLMGHSAGGHLVALMAANPNPYIARGVPAWRATIALDAAGIDIPLTMQSPHPDFYDSAFGTDKNFWHAASPQHQLSANATPILLICATSSPTMCPTAKKFAASFSNGIHPEILPLNLSHKKISTTLGLPGNYTDSVDRFIAVVLK